MERNLSYYNHLRGFWRIHFNPIAHVLNLSCRGSFVQARLFLAFTCTLE